MFLLYDQDYILLILCSKTLNVKLYFDVFNMQIWYWVFSVVQYRE